MLLFVALQSKAIRLTGSDPPRRRRRTGASAKTIHSVCRIYCMISLVNDILLMLPFVLASVLNEIPMLMRLMKLSCYWCVLSFHFNWRMISLKSAFSNSSWLEVASYQNESASTQREVLIRASASTYIFVGRAACLSFFLSIIITQSVRNFCLLVRYQIQFAVKFSTVSSKIVSF